MRVLHGRISPAGRRSGPGGEVRGRERHVRRDGRRAAEGRHVRLREAAGRRRRSSSRHLREERGHSRAGGWWGAPSGRARCGGTAGGPPAAGMRSRGLRSKGGLRGAGERLLQLLHRGTTVHAPLAPELHDRGQPLYHLQCQSARGGPLVRQITTVLTPATCSCFLVWAKVLQCWKLFMLTLI